MTMPMPILFLKKIADVDDDAEADQWKNFFFDYDADAFKNDSKILGNREVAIANF